MNLYKYIWSLLWTISTSITFDSEIIQLRCHLIQPEKQKFLNWSNFLESKGKIFQDIPKLDIKSLLFHKHVTAKVLNFLSRVPWCNLFHLELEYIIASETRSEEINTLNLFSFQFQNEINKIAIYRQLRARRALSLFNDAPLRTTRRLSLCTLYSISPLLVLNGTSLNIDNALLVLNWWYSQLCLSQICWDWRNSFDLEKIWLM